MLKKGKSRKILKKKVKNGKKKIPTLMKWRKLLKYV